MKDIVKFVTEHPWWNTLWLAILLNVGARLLLAMFAILLSLHGPTPPPE